MIIVINFKNSNDSYIIPCRTYPINQESLLYLCIKYDNGYCFTHIELIFYISI